MNELRNLVFTRTGIGGTLQLPTHPLTELLNANDDLGIQVRSNTDAAIKWIEQTEPTFLERILPGVLNVNNPEDAAAKLGELRAYGYLGIASMSPQPIGVGPAQTSDFEVLSSTSPIHIEVHSRQLSPDVAKAQAELAIKASTAAAQLRTSGLSGVVSQTAELAPFGNYRKVGDDPLLNAISKIAGIKTNVPQLAGKLPGILWLDLQGVHNRGMWLSEEDLLPFSSSNERLYCGALWWALYGKKQTELCDGVSKIEPGNTVKLQHDGKFTGKSHISGVIVSMPRRTVLFENPDARSKFSAGFLQRLLLLPHFSLEFSWINTKNDALPEQIARAYLRLQDIRAIFS